MAMATGQDPRMLERLRAALNFAGVGAWEWDLHTGEAWWSDYLHVILGRPINATARGPADRVTRPVSVVSRDGWSFETEMTVFASPAIEGVRFVVTFAAGVPATLLPQHSAQSPWDALNPTRVDAPSAHR